MAKEWILNMANARWGLTKKNKVGPVAAWIRECQPKQLSDWKRFYLEKLSGFLTEKNINLRAEEYLENLGKTLYVKISEVMSAEIGKVTEQDCIRYIEELVIVRTYEGYTTEKRTIYEQLSKKIGLSIEPAPDEWDRLYNVDFYIRVADRYIGLQIKPTTFEHAPEYQTKWRQIYRSSHEEFTKRFGGKVFIILSVTRDNQKEIYNNNVIEDIKQEINRLMMG